MTCINSNIRVCVRVRPLSAAEVRTSSGLDETANCNSLRKCVRVDDDCSLTFDSATDASYLQAVPTHENKRSKELRYAFDRVFGENSTQQQVYENCVKDLLPGVLNGYNATVFAYGATGAGKTHSMSLFDNSYILLTFSGKYRRSRYNAFDNVGAVSANPRS